jgi:hypothetical protein
MERCGFVRRKAEEKGMRIKQPEMAEIAEETVKRKEKRKEREEKTGSEAD